MNAIARITVELSSRCNKECGMCGRTPLRQAGTLDQGDMSLEMAKYIADQIPPRTVVQFHWNGEPTLHPNLATALSYFKHCITGMNTNGKLLVKKANEIIGQIDTLTLSVIQDDPDRVDQREKLLEFLQLKGASKPYMVFRLLGDVDPTFWKRMERQGHGKVATRILHAPEMSRDYEKPVTIPEIGICLDMLHTIAIDYQGNVNHCVRFDPEGLGRIGRLTLKSNRSSLDEIASGIVNRPWHNHPRKRYIAKHVAGERHKVPLCAGCDFYGVPTGRFYGSKQEITQETSQARLRLSDAEESLPSRPGSQVQESTETQEESQVSHSEEQAGESDRRLDVLACQYCADQGKEFVAKSPAGLSSHIRRKHKRGVHQKGLDLE